MEYFVKITAHDGKCIIETVQSEKPDLDFYYQEIDCRCIEIVRMPKLRKKLSPIALILIAAVLGVILS